MPCSTKLSYITYIHTHVMDALLQTGLSSFTFQRGIKGKVGVNIAVQCSVTIPTDHC